MWDGALEDDVKFRKKVTKEGKSPGHGVDPDTPLHVIHALNLYRPGTTERERVRYVKLHIRKPAAGWGVSLWQIDLFES